MASKVRLPFAVLLALTILVSLADRFDVNLFQFDAGASQAGTPQSEAERRVTGASALIRDLRSKSQDIPLRLIGEPLHQAHRDIFSRIEAQAKAPVVAAVQTPVVPVREEAEAIADPPPPMTWRFLGSLRSPDGSVFVYLIDGEQVQIVQAGTDLPSGYRVEKITLNRTSKSEELSVSEVRIVHPSLQLGHTLRISEPEVP